MLPPTLLVLGRQPVFTQLQWENSVFAICISQEGYLGIWKFHCKTVRLARKKSGFATRTCSYSHQAIRGSPTTEISIPGQTDCLHGVVLRESSLSARLNNQPVTRMSLLIENNNSPFIWRQTPHTKCTLKVLQTLLPDHRFMVDSHTFQNKNKKFI